MTLELFSKKSIAVLGLSKSGLSTINFLKKKGFNPIGWDDNLDIRRKAKKKGIKIENFKNINKKNISHLVVSPGIHSSGPSRHTLIKKANLAGIKIINDIELFFQFYPNSNCIGVTGTNGKSTTVSLLHHVFNKIKIRNSLGGNIGKPIFSIKNPGDGFYILEISSFQLELIKSARFKIGIILNITKDHIDRHGSFRQYVLEKIKIYNNQQKSDLSILGIDDEVSQKILNKIKKKNISKVVTISSHYKTSDIYVKNNYLYIKNIFKNKKKIFKKINLRQFENIKGRQNYQNIAAVYAVLIKIGFFDWNKIETALKSFVGLPHRLQTIREINKISYINDSKATNLDSTDKALSSYKKIYWILGGRAKEKNLRILKKHFFKIEHAFLLGETKKIYQNYLKKYLKCTVTKNLKEAVFLSHQLAQNDGMKSKFNNAVVLLSPGCSSLDEWKNFEERGNAFIRLVKKLNN